jgi:hypothetical protein
MEPSSWWWPLVPSVTLSPAPESVWHYGIRAGARLLVAAVTAGCAIAAALLIVRLVPTWMLIPIVLVTAVCIAGIVYDVPEWIRGPDPQQWQWGYRAPLTAARWWPAGLSAAVLLALGVYVAFGKAPAAAVRARIGVIGSIVAGLAFRLALLHFAPHGAAAALAERTMSADMTSYFVVAADTRLSVTEFLRTYAAEMPHRDRHASSHPPGPILFHRAVITFFQRHPRAAETTLGWMELFGVKRSQLTDAEPAPAPLAAAAVAVGFLVLACAALTAWPIAAISLALGADAIGAAQIAILWQFCPSPALFTPQFDQAVTLLAATVCALGGVALGAGSRVKRRAAAFAAGALAGISMFCSFGAPPMLVAAALVVLVGSAAALRTGRRLADAMWAAAVGAVITIAMPMFAGYQFMTTAVEALAISRYDYMLKRQYWTWVKFDLLDFGMFLGPPLVAYAAVSLVGRWRGQPAPSPRLDIFGVVMAFVLVLDISGVTRGEIARLWMPLYPFVLVAALPACNQADRIPCRKQLAGSALLIGVLLAVFCVVVRLYWDPG